jgi:hypothetical protein
VEEEVQDHCEWGSCVKVGRRLGVCLFACERVLPQVGCRGLCPHFLLKSTWSRCLILGVAVEVKPCPALGIVVLYG